jgi:uncharacterized protein (TIRG00374 family)
VRKFVVALALLIGVVFIIGRFAELQSIMETLQRGDFRFIGLAILVEAVWLINLAASYRAIYQALGLEEGILQLVLLATSANFINTVAPSAGMGGVAVFAAESSRKGYSTARATLASMLFVLFEYTAFTLVLSLGLLVLIRRNNLNPPEVVASLILVGLAIIMTILIILGMRSSRRLGDVLAWIARGINRLLRPILQRDYLSEDRAHAFARDAADGLKKLRQTPENLLLPIALSLSSKALLVSVLFLIFLAFKTSFTPGTLIAGFSVGYLFTIVSPTPSGIGVVEGVLALTLNSLGIPLSAAAVITLAYRGVTFWIPLLIGMIAFRRLGQVTDEETAAAVPPAPRRERP